MTTRDFTKEVEIKCTLDDCCTIWNAISIEKARVRKSDIPNKDEVLENLSKAMDAVNEAIIRGMRE